jgi:hypothetical protein
MFFNEVYLTNDTLIYPLCSVVLNDILFVVVSISPKIIFDNNEIKTDHT